MRIIFVRHGQTVFNNEARYQGHLDTALSDLGRSQAQCAADRLKGENISSIYASDLSRAVETAEAISAYYSIEVVPDTDLRECSFGEWEGLTVPEIREQYDEIYENYRQDSIRYRAPGGERLEQLQERVVRAIDKIAAKHPEETVAVVTHGGPIRAFFCHALGAGLQTFRKMHLDNAGITIFSKESNGRWFLESLNDACHIQGLGTDVNQHDETSISDK